MIKNFMNFLKENNNFLETESDEIEKIINSVLDKYSNFDYNSVEIKGNFIYVLHNEIDEIDFDSIESLVLKNILPKLPTTGKLKWYYKKQTENYFLLIRE